MKKVFDKNQLDNAPSSETTVNRIPSSISYSPFKIQLKGESILNVLGEMQNDTLMSYLDEFQFNILGHAVVFTHSEYDANDVLAHVTKLPQMRHDLICLVEVAIHAVLQHVFDQ